MSTDNTNTEQVQEQQEQPKPARKKNKHGDYRGMHYTDKSLENLRQPWQPGQSGNPAGRKPNRVPELLKQYLGTKQTMRVRGLTREEVEDIELMILSLGNKELNALIKGDDVPMYMKGLALAALHDAKNGRTKTIDLLRDRQFGAVKKEVDVTTNGQSMNGQSLTPEEARDFLKKVEESC